jgi:hypothetical protein
MNILAFGSHPDAEDFRAYRIHGYMPDFKLLP